MRRVPLLSLTAGLLGWVFGHSAALAASEAEWRDCKSREIDKARVVAACSRIAADKKATPSERATALNDRGNAYQEKKDFTRAIADYTAALRLDPSLALVYFNRGYAYKEQGEYDRALADCDKALQLAPGNLTILRRRGDVHASRADNAKGDFDHALADYNEVIRQNPDNAGVYRARGLVYEALGDTTRATADYNKFEELLGK